MSRWFTSFTLAAGVLASGCGESTMDAMKRRAQARADAVKVEDEQAKQRIAKAAAQFAELKGKSETEPEHKAANPVQPVNTPAKAPTAPKTQAKAAAEKGPGAAAIVAAIRPPVPVKPESPLNDIQRRNKSALNLDQIIKALNKHAREHGTYPTQAITSQRLGRPLLSWRVAILPELGYAEFYQEFRREEPWDSDHNRALLKYIPEVFVSPERCDEKTNYLAPHGPGTAWHGIRGRDPLSFADGADTTLVLIEADESSAVPWTKPEDLPIDEQTKSRLGNLRGEGFLAAFGSGYVAMIHNKVTDGQLSWMLSSDGDDFLNDRSIIFDATIPDVALVTDKPQLEEPMDSSAGDSAKTKESSNASSAIADGAKVTDRPGGIPPVRLPTPPKKPERLAVPPEEELAKAREELREIFYAEYKASKSKADLRKLAVKMLGEAARLENEPAAYHELLQMVRKMAVQTGDLTSAMKAVELLETKLELPSLALRLTTIDELAGAIGESNQGAGQLAAEAEKVFISAFEQDEFSIALEAHRIYMGLIRKGSDSGKVGRMSLYRGVIVEAEKAYQLVPAALSALSANGEDTQANDVAGKFFCLIKNEWEIGLPMMARGSDLKLRLLARMDLEQGKSGHEIIQLADHYYELAQEFKQPQRRCLELRAAHHYAAARPFLMPGVDLVKADKRIEEIRKANAGDVLVRASAPAAALPATGASPKDDSG